MGKMEVKKQEQAEQTETPPLLTFSEQEVQKVANFVNFVYLNAEFKSGMKGFKAVNDMFKDMHEHVAKIESYIFEHKKTVKMKG